MAADFVEFAIGEARVHDYWLGVKDCTGKIDHYGRTAVFANKDNAVPLLHACCFQRIGRRAHLLVQFCITPAAIRVCEGDCVRRFLRP